MDKQKKKERNKIVLNKLFCGSYLQDNIGHEIINMYQADDGKKYVYIQPYGTFGAEHANSIKHVLHTRTVEGYHALEVLGVAWISNDIYNPKSDKEETLKNQENLCDSITYGAKNLNDIFKANEINERQDVYVSLEAEKVMRPNKKVYLSFSSSSKKKATEQNNASSCNKNKLSSFVDKDAIIVSMTSNYAKSSMKQYFSLNDNNEDYNKLVKLIEQPGLWAIPIEGINSDLDAIKIKEDNYFDVCGIDDYELAFSNALAYYMRKYPELVVEFTDKVLGKKTDVFHSVKREMENIDLYLENETTVVVIENKITSKINGVKVTDHKQTGNQLRKYYNAACNIETREEDKAKNIKKGKGRKVVCYILSPDYNKINLDDYCIDYDKGYFDCGKIYTEIHYSQVYEFLKKKEQELPYSNDIYFKEFVKGLEKHSKSYHDDLFEDTMQRFVKQLKNSNKNKH